MRGERLLRVLAEGRTALGASLHLQDPAVVEIAALAGFDWVTIAIEHAPLSVHQLVPLQLAADARDITMLVLVEQPDDPRLLPLVNAGLGGVVLAHASGAAPLEELVHTVRFPPLGERGAHGAVRSADYGATPYAEYVVDADASLVVGLVIEDRAGLDAAEEIFSVPGVDFAYIGIQDLAQSLGVPGEMEHPIVRDALANVLRVGREKGVRLAVSQYGYTVEELRDLGISMISTTLDYSSLLSAFRADVERTRAELARLGAR